MIVCSFLQLLHLLEVIVDNAQGKSDISDKSGASASEQPSGPESSTSDVGMNREPGQISSGVSTSSKDVDSSKPTTSDAPKEVDSRTVLLSLPQAELRLLCALLAREGYDVAFGMYKLHFFCHCILRTVILLTTKTWIAGFLLLAMFWVYTFEMFSLPSIHRYICVMAFVCVFYFFVGGKGVVRPCLTHELYLMHLLCRHCCG